MDQKFVLTDKKLITYYLVKLKDRQPVPAFSYQELHYGDHIQTMILNGIEKIQEGYVVGKIECSSNTMRMIRKRHGIASIQVKPYKKEDFIEAKNPIKFLDELF